MEEEQYKVVNGLSRQIADDLVGSCEKLCGEMHQLIMTPEMQSITTLEEKVKDVEDAQKDLENQATREIRIKDILTKQKSEIAALEQQLSDATEDDKSKIQDEIGELTKTVNTSQTTLEHIAKTKKRLEEGLAGQEITPLKKQLEEAKKCSEFARLNELKLQLKSNTILDFLDQDTMNRIVDKIKRDQGHIQFKTDMKNRLIKAAMNTWFFKNETVIDYVKSFFPLLIRSGSVPTLDNFCGASLQCDVQFLSSMIYQIMLSFDNITTTSRERWSVFKYIGQVFELKEKPAGGRRTRKQKHRRHKTRGHKSRRHNRHSTRKHH
jgi:nucleoside-triphosphatase THEP1